MPDVTVSAAGMRLVKLLVGNPPQAIQEVCDATGITRTAVTEQLDELLAAGYVQRSVQRRSHRGRPRYVYSVTDAGLADLFMGNQWLLVPALWRAVEDVGGTKLKNRVLNKASRTVANHYKDQIKGNTPEKRLREVARVLREIEGNEVEVEKGPDGKLLLRKRTCSFFTMFEATRSVCRMDEKILSELVGVPVRRIASRHDGSPCCVFQIDDAD